MWDQYHHESDQTVTVVGVLILSAKLCVADGHFSEREEEEILKIVPHEPRQKKILKTIDILSLNWSNKTQYELIFFIKICFPLEKIILFLLTIYQALSKLTMQI